MLFRREETLLEDNFQEKHTHSIGRQIVKSVDRSWGKVAPITMIDTLSQSSKFFSRDHTLYEKYVRDIRLVENILKRQSLNLLSFIPLSPSYFFVHLFQLSDIISYNKIGITNVFVDGFFLSSNINFCLLQ